MPFPLFVLGSLGIAAITMAATARLSSRPWLPIAVAVTGALALLLFHSLAYLNFVVDDAFINFRYSRNLADGLGPNWNSDGRVEGYTNFLWMAGLAGVAKLGIDIVIAARVLGFVAVGATAFVLYRLWQLWGRENEGSGIESPIVFAAAIVGLALTDSVAYWTSAGLETPLFMALLTGGAYLHLTERRGGGLPWSAAVFAAAAMTRPEGLIAVAVTGAFKLLALGDRDDRQQALATLVLWSSVFLALYGSYFVWRYSYYDYLLPNTFYAKVGSSSAFYERGLEYVSSHGLRYHLTAMFVGAAILFTRPSLRHDGAYVIALCSALLAAIVVEGGDFMSHARFIAPVLPLLYLSGLSGLAMLLKQTVATIPARTLVASGALGLAALALVPNSYDSLLPLERDSQQNRKLLGDWVSEHVPEEYTLAAHAVGALGYYSERNVLDMFGINNVTIAHTDVPAFGKGASGHEKYNVDYVLDDAQPELMYVTEGIDTPQTADELVLQSVSGASFAPGRSALLTDPRLWENYRVRWLFLEDRWFNLLQRNDTVDELRAPGLVGDDNFLQEAGATDLGGWGAWRSTLQPRDDAVLVSSSEIAYSAFQSSTGLEPQAGATYVALAWVRGRGANADGQIEIVVREDGARDGESLSIGPLTAEWQPIWVTHTVTTPGLDRLDVHILRLGGEAKAEAFLFRDAQLRLITE